MGLLYVAALDGASVRGSAGRGFCTWQRWVGLLYVAALDGASVRGSAGGGARVVRKAAACACLLHRERCGDAKELTLVGG